MLWLNVVEWIARLILVLLVFLSFWSISIMIERRRYFRGLELGGEATRNSIKAGSFSFSSQGFFDGILREIAVFKNAAQIDKAFESLSLEKRKEMEKGLPVLGTLGSTTPFVGLLGTILGIIVSFGELSKGAGSSNAVMFSLAEALILTALGLIVAIPAVVAFNFFNRRVKLILNEAAGLKDLYLAYRDDHGR